MAVHDAQRADRLAVEGEKRDDLDAAKPQRVRRLPQRFALSPRVADCNTPVLRHRDPERAVPERMRSDHLALRVADTVPERRKQPPDPIIMQHQNRHVAMGQCERELKGGFELGGGQRPGDVRLGLHE